MRLEVAESVTVHVMSTEEPLLAKISGAPSILVIGTEIKVRAEGYFISCVYSSGAKKETGGSHGPP